MTAPQNPSKSECGTRRNRSAIIDWALGNGGTISHHAGHPTQTLQVHTLEGVMSALPGDWIIRGVAGEFYPCREDIFQATYEATTRPMRMEGRDDG